MSRCCVGWDCTPLSHGRYYSFPTNMAALTYFLLSSLAFVHASENTVVYPLDFKREKLATRINCQVGESRNFHYSSITSLWGSIEGQINLNGDVMVYCLGNDVGGKYGAEALKYFVEISDLSMTESSHEKPASGRLSSFSSTRRKRGIGDFFKESWTKIKNFFGRLFGGRGSEAGKSRDAGRREIETTDAEDDKKTPADAAKDEEDENTMNYESIYTLPFEFVQLANGSIPEVRFSQEETDGRVRNFKRHIIDSFATQLTPRSEMTRETSVIGEHLTNYSITLGSEGPQRLELVGSQASPLTDRKEDPLGENHVLVEKFITEDDILNLASDQKSAALNDRDKMGLKAEQRQIFVSGKLISSSGKSSFSLFDATRKSRKKRSVDDVLSFFQAESEFVLKLEKRRRRWVSQNMLQKLQEKSMKFTAASRSAEVEDSAAKQKLKNFQESVGNTTAFVLEMLNNSPTDDEKIQTVFEMVEEEVRLGLDYESHSMAAAIRKIFPKEKMLSLCQENFSRCRDFLQLLSLAGGSEAEQVMLSCLSDGRLNLLDRKQVADIVSEVSRPSDRFLSTLIGRLEGSTLETELRGALCLSVATIVAQSTQQLHKSKMAEVLVSTLEKELTNGCSNNPLILDLLEAMGNLGQKSTMDCILKVSSKCSERQEIQIACAHAFRRLSAEPQVQLWMLKAVNSQSCDLIRAVLGSLLDETAFQEKTRDFENWPRNGFNDIDEVIKSKLSSSSVDFVCAIEDAVRYFRKKRDDRAKEIANGFYTEDAEVWNPGSGSRQKRDVWDKLNCKEWTEDKVYRPIQDKQQFDLDRAKYNRRKSCLASRQLGLRGANAEVYAGMFAGVKEPSDPPEYKLFTKFVSGLNFLGHELEIGSFYFYHHSGNTKAYVRIMGRTRQEFSNEGCTPTELRYRPITHIPLFLVTVSVVQLSLGIHLSSQLSLDTQCSGAEVYNLLPLTNVRVGGEAMGTVLFARGALNLGGNFNYHLQFTFKPVPDMCLEGYHGHDPMSVSIEAYYQMWNAIKKDWGKHRIWRPSFMSWQVAKGRHQPWFNDTCVLKLPDANPPTDGVSTPPEENVIVKLLQ